MRRSSLPNVKDNLVITRANARYPHSQNVSRSWQPRDVVARVRTEERLARSVGERSQERKVLEWCKKNNVNVIRKLPKLDSTVITSRGINEERFTSFVDEAKLVKREQPVKPPDYNKEKARPSTEHRENFCAFCQRDLPKKRQRARKSTFFTSPYECEHCGASNDIYLDSDKNVSESESEDDPKFSESVHDTIRRGNPEQVIDHRTFSEDETKSESLERIVDIENDESDIFWRSDSDFNSFPGNFEENLADINLNEDCYSGTVFLTETSLGSHSIPPVEVKVAWDDDNSNQFAEISRTIATDDGIEDDVTSQESCDVTSQDSQSRMSNNFEESSLENPGTNSLSLENDSIDLGPRLSPTPPPPQGRRGSSPRNFLYGEHPKRRGSEEVHVTSMDGSYDMTQSPIANRSVGLTRVALMRLSRSKTRGSRSSPGTPQPVARSKEESRSHSHDPQDSYSFLDAVSPEIKSIHKHENRQNSSDSQDS
ncbi:uncharacterized protein LOC114521739 [Dendronephthya gigantea]|uniref:uncharacterized protein LOC114521739 n=1 Tax=Dendronephthya gigantea TaxID=151771 RepID=UPI00106BD6F9|nr:uncharacterized protein LOC114521739 [Dendronephthya gigantea]